MTLIEALRNAASIAVIVQLLGSYLETVEAYDRGRVLTETLTVRPVRGERDLEREVIFGALGGFYAGGLDRRGSSGRSWSRSPYERAL